MKKIMILFALFMGVTSLSVVSDASAQEAKTVTHVDMELRGDGRDHARHTLRMDWYGENLLPTGVAAKAGEEITVTVKVPQEGQPLPTLVFTQQKGNWDHWKSEQKLEVGTHTYKVPTIYNNSWTQKMDKGGAIYVMYPYTEEQVGEAPEVIIEGGHNYPVYEYGENVEAFRQELRAYKQKREANPQDYIDVVDLVNDYVLMNANMQAADVFIQENNPKNPQEVMEFHADMFKKLLAFAGVTDNDSNIKHNRNGARASMRLMQPLGAAYAYDDHMGFQQGTMNELFRGNTYGWLIPHEIGHQLDIATGYISETTNNMWANYNQVILNGQGDRIPDEHYTAIFKKVSTDNYKALDYKVLDGLAVWWQLYLYDQNYWANYSKAFRDGKLDGLRLNNNENMVVASSIALNMDMTEHFARHKFITEETATKLQDIIRNKLAIPEKPQDIKTWYMHTKAVKSDVKTFADDYVPEIVDVKKIGKNIQLKLDIDDAAKDALLGYEILEDGKVIGFTNTSVFTSIQGYDNQPHNYTVRAYDLKQNTTDESEPFMFDSSEPSIKVIKSTIVPVTTPVNVTEHTAVTDVNGNVLDVQVVAGSVKSDEIGPYTVKYRAIDYPNAKVGHEDVVFHVASKVVYASELDAVATTGHNGLKTNRDINNGTISLLANGKEQVFEYGVGAHASSQVEYDVNGQYDLFEAFIGLDDAVRHQNKANASFKVLADGDVIFESDVFTNTTEMEHVKLNIKGAKKITLITTSNGLKDYDHTIWADAKFARINVATDEYGILRDIQDILKDALTDVNLNDINMIRYNSNITYPATTEAEKLVTNVLNEKLKDTYPGSLNIFVSNMNKTYKTVKDLIKDGSTISYKKKNGQYTYILNGNEFVRGSW